MVDIDGVNVVPRDPADEARAKIHELTRERNELKHSNASMTRKMRRVREVAKELETVAPHAAILIEGALER